MWATALFVFLGLVSLSLFISFVVPLFMPKSYSIEKSITVNATPEACYDKVADLNHYAAWNPWSRIEPDASKKVTGTPKTVGHRYEWEGMKIGTGSLTVNKLDPPHAAHIDLEFVKPWAAKANDDWKFEQVGDQTRVTWKNAGPLAYPMARLMGPMIKKNLDKQFVEGLNNLKQVCEK